MLRSALMTLATVALTGTVGAQDASAMRRVSDAATVQDAPDAGPTWVAARVLRVVDGDSLWVRPPGRAPLRLRLSGVDAPELCQRHGPQAREALARHLAGQTVRVSLLRRDTYDRWLARVEGPQGDVGTWLVAQGHAWSMRWHNNLGPYAAQERVARQARRGLFSQPNPEPPRDFRQRHGPCQTPSAPHTAQPG